MSTVQVGPRSASSASRHSTSSRKTPPAENRRFTTPAGVSVGSNSTASRFSTAALPAGLTCLHLQAETRSNRSAARQRRNSGLSPSAESQSKRSSPITSRFSCGRHNTSATFTVASCKWVEMIARSSSSRATNFSDCMGFASLPSCWIMYEVVRKWPAIAQAASAGDLLLPACGEKVGMRGRFRESKLVEAPPHRAEFWFSLSACGPLPASGARNAALLGNRGKGPLARDAGSPQHDADGLLPEPGFVGLRDLVQSLDIVGFAGEHDLDQLARLMDDRLAGGVAPLALGAQHGEPLR